MSNERPPTLTPVPGGYLVRMRCGTTARERIVIVAKDEPRALERYWRLRRMVDALVRAKRGPEAAVLVKEAAGQKTDRGFGGVERAAADLAATPLTPAAPAPAVVTYGEVVRQWLSGEIIRQFPGEVKTKTEGTVEQQWGMYNKLILRARTTSGGSVPLGERPVSAITKAELIEVKKSLPPMSQGRRRYYCMLLAAPLRLAVYPLDVIERSPVPPGFVPPKGGTRAFTYLYPEEDEQMLACTRISLVQRIVFGLTARNGMRISETLGLTESDVDLRRGNLSLDHNKTKLPRAWKLDPDCATALRLWVAMCPPGPGGLLFPGVELAHTAQRFRTYLRWAGLSRRELFATTAERRPIRVHDLRASFVTLALAAGRGAPTCELWIRDRTGHTTSKMMEQYRRWSRFALDNQQGWFTPLDRAIPELVAFARGGRSLVAGALAEALTPEPGGPRGGPTLTK